MSSQIVDERNPTLLTEKPIMTERKTKTWTPEDFPDPPKILYLNDYVTRSILTVKVKGRFQDMDKEEEEEKNKEMKQKRKSVATS